jgi:RNA polymerase sigma-70 factor (ECF subfamily)
MVFVFENIPRRRRAAAVQGASRIFIHDGKPDAPTIVMRLFWGFIRIASRMANSIWLAMNSMELETREIAHGLRRRDPDLLDELIGRYQYRLPRYLWTLTGNHETAEDLFQETWIRVLEKSHLYNPQWRFETWLFSIARNLAIDLLRRRDPESLDALLDPGDERPAREWPDRESATPFETVAAGEQAEHVKSVLRQLPPEAREVLVLRFQEDLSLNEIADVTGAPLSTVKSRLYRGLEAFRNLLMS